MKNGKNKYGQYFTTGPIAEFMVNLIGHKLDAKVLEPCCGKGVFIEKLIKAGFNDISAYEIDRSLKTDFDFVKYESFVSSPLSERFDVIIGNPPYIRWKNLEQELKEELQESPLWNRYFNCLCDYLFIFILKSIEQLNENGELIFICPEYWMNTTHSETLRNYMVDNGYFTDIFHFKEAKLFEKVTASLIVFRYIKSKNRQKQINFHLYTSKDTPDLETLSAHGCFKSKQIPQFVKDSRWMLADEDEQKLIRNFEKNCAKLSRLFSEMYETYRLGDFCDIGNGMVSGLDKAFCIKDKSNLNTQEKLSLINVYKAKDLCPYYNTSVSHYIFINDKITEEEFKSQYPHFYTNLFPYKEQLSERYSYGKELMMWEFAFPRNENLFRRKQDRIFVPCKERISNKNYFRFAMADCNTFPLQDVTCLIPNKYCKESVEYILAYLNNERIFKWMLISGIIKGNIVEFSEVPLSNIPYRPINWSDEREIMIHNEITNNVSLYLQTKDVNYKAEIDKLINKLFYE